jgi:hypothetical protein
MLHLEERDDQRCVDQSAPVCPRCIVVPHGTMPRLRVVFHDGLSALTYMRIVFLSPVWYES